MLAVFCWALAAATGLPMLMLAIECLVGAAPDRKQSYPLPPPFVVLIPAHDEGRGISAVVRAVRAQLRPCDRMMLVADNCTDDTAAIASVGGAAIVKRDEPDLRGKAYALAYGRAALRQRPAAIVIILDADCLPGPRALSRLAAHAAWYGAVVQGRYLLDCPSDATPLVRVSSLAFMIKNLVRQRGLQRLGGGALLQGTGMAFPWSIFETAPLETASLVEDLKLGLDLRLAGHSVRFDSHASFASDASAQIATQGQRTRWEHGSVITALHYIPRLILSGLSNRPALLVLAVDLSIPPLSLLGVLAMASGMLLAILAILTGLIVPLIALLTLGGIATGALVIAWFMLGRSVLPGRMVTQIPRYLLWKLPIYRRLVGARQKRWVRTSREP
jgi:cellulose synthase/poly-beta-1,6-N-acetylglucosamine synthase-like glycosyltransferase